MRFNFRKISAIAASALMAGMTLGAAAAANYPAPFVSGGSANVAIVYGTGAGVSSLDLVQAGNIQDSLEEFVSGGSVVVEGGESFLLEKSSNSFNFNNDLDAVYADLDDAEMDFLADGTYDDGDIDETFTQKITLSSKTLGLFADSDYNNKEPTIGFKWTNNQYILDYLMEFDDTIVLTDMNDTDLPLMGSTYYVLTATDNVIEMLDSAEKVVLSEGDTVTVGGKDVEIEYINANDVKFTVDGEITKKLSDHEYDELDDGSYIVVNEIMYSEKEAGVSKVEFSIGAGKMTLETGEEIQLNDEDVDGLVSIFDGDSINITWLSDGESFLTEANALTMPLFESIKLAFGGMNFPDSPEMISLETGDTMTLVMDNYELPLFTFAGAAGAASTLGEEDYPLVTAATTLTANYTGSAGANSTVLTGGLDLVEDNRFLVTSIDDDLGDIQTLYYEVKTVDWDSPDVLVELEDLIGDRDLTLDAMDDSQDVEDVTVTLRAVNDTHVYLKFSGATTVYNMAVSDLGLKVILPENTSTQTCDLENGVPIFFVEANKDDEIGNGMWFSANVKATGNEKLHVVSTNVTTLEDADDVYIGYVPSDLTTKVTHDETGDEYDFELEYYGEEVTADVMVVGGSSTISGGESGLGNILVKDSEVSSVATKNLIVVGGSCINSAAAALVGGTKCGASWTAATGIGTGQFLIKGYADSTITSKLALLVAGYDAEDTVKATTYLVNKNVDTSKAYKGTSSTELAVEIEEA
jgi:hypothetical protein